MTTGLLPPSVINGCLVAPQRQASADAEKIDCARRAASDNVAVAAVQFFVDGVAIGSPVTASPYTTTWDCTGIGDGPHLLDVVARDTSGNSATSSINIMVENMGP
jgi:Bacterial Ig domain